MMRQAACGLLLLLATAGTASADPDGQSFDQISRGRYLAALGDCAACHTIPGGPLYGGGRPLETPFGTLLAPNLTPDRETGIGGWTGEQFVAALRDGKFPGGHLYPAMPYTYYARMTRDDALAIRAYLATVEPVRNDVVSNQLPFPFSIRASMVAWNALFFTPGEFKPVAGKSAEWNRGAYLVEGLGHCGMCHTEKNFLGGDHTSRALQGGVLQGWFSPNVTGDARTGVGGWSVDDIVEYLQTGHNRIAAATGPMSEVITNSTSKLDREDLAAIATYLKDTAPQGGAAPAPLAANDPAMRAGAAVYIDHCGACHAPAGTGIVGLFPSLKGSPSVQSADATSLIRVVLEGAQSVATDPAPTGAAMPSFGWKLNDDQIAAVITYIRNSWGNAASAVSTGDVGKSRKQLSQAAP
ncbi:MAG TPA: cytochrome c [Stellaceae bacterium]|nr:cytochrome c [Stellaceae bacterium]